MQNYNANGVLTPQAQKKFALTEVTDQVNTPVDGTPPPPVEYVVAPLIPKGEITILQGDAGTGKTHLAVALIHAVYSRTQWLGCPVETPQNRIVYFDVESGVDLFSRYLQGYCAERRDVGWASSVHHCAIEPGAFDAEVFEDAMRDAKAVRGGEAFAVLDNLSDLAVTGDVNAAHHVVKTLRPIADVCKRNGWTLVCLDYPAKHQGAIAGGESEQEKGTPYGAASKLWIARSVLQVVLHRKTTDNNGIAGVHCTLRHVKSNFGTAQDIPFTLRFWETWWDISLGTTEEHGSLGHVLEVITELGQATVEEIAERVDLSERHVRRHLYRLHQEGRIEKEQLSPKSKVTWRIANPPSSLDTPDVHHVQPVQPTRDSDRNET